MKILVSAFACDPDAGSEPSLGYNFAAYLAEAGHDVWCITRPLGRENIEREVAKLNHGRLRFHYIWPPVLGARVYKNYPEMYLNYLLWQGASGRLGTQLDRTISFDAVHHITHGSLAFGSGMWRVGKPLFFGPAGGGQMPPLGFEAYLGKARTLERLRTITSWVLSKLSRDHRHTMRRARGIFVSNEATARMARKSGAKNVIYLADPALPPDWNSKVERTAGAPTHIKLLWVGRLMPIKGPVFAIEALALSKMPNWSLTMVGDGPLAEEVDTAIERLGLSGRATRTGRVPFSQMPQIYAEHDMLCATSLRESVGIQLLEAMASGMPVLTLDLHGAGLFVPDAAGVKVPVTSPEATKLALAQALDAVCRQPERIVPMRQAAVEAARDYLWPNKIRRISQYYPGS